MKAASQKASIELVDDEDETPKPTPLPAAPAVSAPEPAAAAAAAPSAAPAAASDAMEDGEKDEKDEKEDKTPRKPCLMSTLRSLSSAPLGGGGSTDKYVWTQTLRDATVLFEVPSCHIRLERFVHWLDRCLKPPTPSNCK